MNSSCFWSHQGDHHSHTFTRTIIKIVELRVKTPLLPQVNCSVQFLTCLLICIFYRNCTVINRNVKFDHFGSGCTKLNLPWIIVLWRCQTSIQLEIVDGTDTCCFQMAVKSRSFVTYSAIISTLLDCHHYTLYWASPPKGHKASHQDTKPPKVSSCSMMFNVL